MGGYNIKCFKTTLENCKKTCAKTTDCRIAEYSAGAKTCCTSKYATKGTCPGSFSPSSAWKGYVVCGAPVSRLAGTSLKCGSIAGPICMGYNLRCFRTTLTACKAECKKVKACKIAEYSAGSRTCCTSKYATKKTCPGSFSSSSAWKGYVVCGAPKEPTLKGTSLKCGAVAGPICMGYNIRCWSTTLAGCIAGCKADKKKGCTIAEYSTGKTCCTSKYATKKTCPGSFATSSAWKGYVVC